MRMAIIGSNCNGANGHRVMIRRKRFLRRLSSTESRGVNYMITAPTLLAATATTQIGIYAQSARIREETWPLLSNRHPCSTVRRRPEFGKSLAVPQERITEVKSMLRQFNFAFLLA